MHSGKFSQKKVLGNGSIPGVGRAAAEIIVSEIGSDMNRFPTADHLASWAGVAPGNNESAWETLII